MNKWRTVINDARSGTGRDKTIIIIIIIITVMFVI